MKKRLILLLLILFFVFIPLIILIYSYIPANMIKLATESKWEYFYRNILDDFSLKLIIATLISGVIDGGLWLLIQWLRGSENNEKNC